MYKSVKMKSFTLILFALYFSQFSCLFRELYTPTRNLIQKCTSEAGTPLILTPLLRSGKINEARNYSEVSPLRPNVYGNAGYFTVDEAHESNLFFWFFRKTDADWEKAPLVLWLQGGPGCSSLFGLFTENGPFVVTRCGLQKRKYSWTNNYNVLYIDQPVGTGFSFTNAGYVRTQEEVGEHLYEALTQFFLLYPELKTNDFYVSGESYAGKYVPAIAYKIWAENQRPRRSESIINLKGLFIGNGLSDPENMLIYSEFLHYLGLIDSYAKRDMRRLEDETRALIYANRTREATNKYYKVIEVIKNVTGFAQLYDYMHENWDGGGDLYATYVQSDAIRKSIHVGQTNYDICNQKVQEYLIEDITRTVRPWIEKLLQYYPVTFYNGQLDIIVGYPLTVNFLSNLRWAGAAEFNSAKRRKWYVGNSLAGYYKHGGNLTEVMVRNSGHMVSSSHPLYALNLLNKFINKEF